MLSRLESRFGHWAIPNVTVIIIAGQVLLYFLNFVQRGHLAAGDPLTNLYLEPAKILEGQVWRLVSPVFLPPNAIPIFALIGWWLFYIFGSTLEAYWGIFRFNVFLFVGLLANIVAAFITWYLWGLPRPFLPNSVIIGSSAAASNALLFGSVILAFSRVSPNFILHIFFVLPIKIKWLALLAWIGYGYGFLKGPGMARVLILAALLNYILFFGKEHLREWKQGRRRRSYQATAKTATKKIQHQCLVCELNSENSPRTLFRYCSKCDGQCCYCPEHIQNHEHAVGESD